MRSRTCGQNPGQRDGRSCIARTGKPARTPTATAPDPATRRRCRRPRRKTLPGPPFPPPGQLGLPERISPRSACLGTRHERPGLYNNVGTQVAVPRRSATYTHFLVNCVEEICMRQSSSTLHLLGEIVSIVLLALTGRFIGFAQTTLEAGVPLAVDAALGHFARLLSVFTRIDTLSL